MERESSLKTSQNPPRVTGKLSSMIQEKGGKGKKRGKRGKRGKGGEGGEGEGESGEQEFDSEFGESSH